MGATGEQRQEKDLYPSRVSSTPNITSRLDPVIWGDIGAEAPPPSADVVSYDREGFLYLESFFPESEVEEMQDELARLRDDASIRACEETFTEPGSDEVRSIFDIHILSPVFAKIANDERLTAIARFILDDDVYVHQSRLNYKPGFTGKEFYWHSDFETWHVEDGMPCMRALSMSVTLTENNEFNGPLMLIPGSHRFYVSCVGETPEDHYKQSLKKQEYGVPDPESLRFLAEKGGIVAPKGPAGSVVIFDCNTIHGSNGNISPYPRSNAFFVFNAQSNRLVEPFGGVKPRPSFIAHRESVSENQGHTGESP